MKISICSSRCGNTHLSSQHLGRMPQVLGQSDLHSNTLSQNSKQPDAVAHTFHPSTWEEEAGISLSSRPAWSTEQVSGQLHREIISERYPGLSNPREIILESSYQMQPSISLNSYFLVLEDQLSGLQMIDISKRLETLEDFLAVIFCYQHSASDPFSSLPCSSLTQCFH